MAIIVTSEEKDQLQKADSLIRDLPGANGSDHASYHNPETGQEMSGPTDPYHMTRRLRQGWRLGPAPTELKAKWLVREQELKEEDDRRDEEYKTSDEHKVNLNAQADRFNEAVATAVTQVLEKLGADLPNERGQAHPQTEEEASEVDHDVQLPLLVPEDAPSESETKHEVSPASRPELHLVE